MKTEIRFKLVNNFLPILGKGDTVMMSVVSVNSNKNCVIMREPGKDIILLEVDCLERKCFGVGKEFLKLVNAINHE